MSSNLCPECGTTLVFQDGCQYCLECGWENCNQNTDFKQLIIVEGEIDVLTLAEIRNVIKENNMCQVKSMIVLKNKVFCPLDYDNHTDMLEELNIEDNEQNASNKFVRVELTPVDGDYFNHNLDNWKLGIDQDVKPAWFDEFKYNEKCKKELQKWFNERFLINKSINEIKNGKWYIKNAQIEYVNGNAQIECVNGNTQIKYVNDNAQIEYVNGNTQIKYVYGNAQIKYVNDDAQIKYVNDNTQIKRVNDNAQIECVNDNTQIECVNDNTQIEYVNGNTQIKYVYGNAQIKYVNDDAQIKYVYGNAQIECVNGNAQITTKNINLIKLISDKAIIRDISKNKPIIYVADTKNFEFKPFPKNK